MQPCFVLALGGAMAVATFPFWKAPSWQAEALRSTQATGSVRVQLLHMLRAPWYIGRTSDWEGNETMRERFWEDAGSWPSLSDAAGMLSLHKATISRQARRGNITARSVGFGHSKRVVSPAEVLRLGRVYQRIPIAVLERRLAAYVAARTQEDVEAIERSLSEDLGVGEPGGPAGTRGEDGVQASGVPTWMLEFDRLQAASFRSSADPPFVAAAAASDTVYVGRYYVDGDDVTLVALTGLDPAIFR